MSLFNHKTINQMIFESSSALWILKSVLLDNFIFKVVFSVWTYVVYSIRLPNESRFLVMFLVYAIDFLTGFEKRCRLEILVLGVSFVERSSYEFIECLSSLRIRWTLRWTLVQCLRFVCLFFYNNDRKFFNHRKLARSRVQYARTASKIFEVVFNKDSTR